MVVNITSHQAEICPSLWHREGGQDPYLCHNTTEGAATLVIALVRVPPTARVRQLRSDRHLHAVTKGVWAPPIVV
jgi:hypothetical protein